MRVVKGAFAQQTAARYLWVKVRGEKYKNKKSNKINSLLDSCIADKLIDPVTVKRDGEDKIVIKNSFAGEEFCGLAAFLQELFTRYDKVWKILVFPAITFVAGILVPYLPRFLHALQSAIAR